MFVPGMNAVARHSSPPFAVASNPTPSFGSASARCRIIDLYIPTGIVSILTAGSPVLTMSCAITQLLPGYTDPSSGRLFKAQTRVRQASTVST